MHITILGTSAIGYSVLKDITATSSMFWLKSIFSTNKDVTGFHAWDFPGFDSKTHTVNTGTGIFKQAL